jgi:hypothetical protein
MRHRERSSISPTTGVFERREVHTRFESNGSSTVLTDTGWFTDGMSTTESGTFEEMDDVVSEGARVDHPCYHTRNTVVYHKLDVYEKRYCLYNNTGCGVATITGPRVEREYFFRGGPTSTVEWSPAPDLPDASVLSQAEFASALVEHYEKVRNPVKERISLANFLLELGDIKRTFTSIESFFNDPNRYADPVLAAEFGIKPFLADLNSINSSLLGLRSDIDRLFGNASSSTVIRTEREVRILGYEEFVHDSSTPSTGGAIRPLGSDVKNPSARIVFHTTVSYDTAELKGLRRALYSYSRCFGLSNPLKVAWNAIPYSFVVDWFLNVGSLLNFLDLATPFVPAYVRKTTTHFYLSRTQKAYVTILTAAGLVIERDVLAATKINSVYNRWVGYPVELTLGIQSISFREQMLSVLLASQRLIEGKHVFKRFRFSWLTPIRRTQREGSRKK